MALTPLSTTKGNVRAATAAVAVSGLSLSKRFKAAQRLDFDDATLRQRGRKISTTLEAAARNDRGYGYLASVVADPRWDKIVAKTGQQRLLAVQQRLASALLLTSRADLTHSFYAAVTQSANIDIISLVGAAVRPQRYFYRLVERDARRTVMSQREQQALTRRQGHTLARKPSAAWGKPIIAAPVSAPAPAPASANQQPPSRVQPAANRLKAAEKPLPTPLLTPKALLLGAVFALVVGLCVQLYLGLATALPRAH